MTDPLYYTSDDEIADVRMSRPHVVILGAGASRAACPTGDRNGSPLPLMADFSSCLGLQDLLRGWGLDPAENFEDTYSRLHEDGCFDRTARLADCVESYFSSLALPDMPTVYDHLIMGLRETDLIATFNWDPLLLQAYQRTPRTFGRPKIAFLHGNVGIGYCDNDEVTGLLGNSCGRCGEPLRRMPLLYPVRNKDYATDPAISAHWDLFKSELAEAFMVTVFGYSGPKTDAEAIALMSSAWGTLSDRSMEQFAFVTLQSNQEILEAWQRFIHTHHYEVQHDFLESWIAMHPRRTGEAYISQYLEAKFVSGNPAPRSADLQTLWAWFGRFLDAENGSRI